jgi:hypothetical protein
MRRGSGVPPRRGYRVQKDQRSDATEVHDAADLLR